MVVSESLLKWIMRFYPPLFFQRIWVVKFEKAFRGVHVKINKSFLTKNYNNSIFGGTIFSAADPFYPLLFHQILSHKGYRIDAWSRSSEIRFFKPGLSDLYFSIQISDEDIAEAEQILLSAGKYKKAHPVDIYTKDGKLCASLMNEVCVRNLNYTESL